MDDLMQRTTQDIWKSLVNKKDKLIREALISKGYNVDEVLKPSRFPKMVIESDSEWELYFYNDGSEFGEFIIGFQKPSVDFAHVDYSNVIQANIKYTTNFSPLFKNK